MMFDSTPLICHFSSDIYAAGLILLEAVLGTKIWKSKKNIRQLIHEKLQIVKKKKHSNVAETIIHQLGLGKHFENLHPNLQEVIIKATSNWI